MKKGFTLLELLIVIGILAILSTTMVLVINPAEMLKKARDSQRISDLNSLKSAISLYLTDVASPSIGNATLSYCYNTSTTCLTRTADTRPPSQAINGNGWIPINFASTSGGSPISALPIDPNPATGGTNNRFYVYLPFSDNTFELAANMESIYYANGGSGDVESKDGGYTATVYELGTKIDPTTDGLKTGCFGTNP